MICGWSSVLPDGSIEWDKTIGGATSDNASGNVVQWPDGSFVILGLSQSFISGDKTEASYGSFDYWMVRIDSARNILWQKTYGGIGGEYYATFLSLDDYSILIAGMSQPGISGNKTVSFGASDMDSARAGFHLFWIQRSPLIQYCTIPH